MGKKRLSPSSVSSDIFWQIASLCHAIVSWATKMHSGLVCQNSHPDVGLVTWHALPAKHASSDVTATVAKYQPCHGLHVPNTVVVGDASRASLAIHAGWLPLVRSSSVPTKPWVLRFRPKLKAHRAKLCPLLWGYAATWQITEWNLYI